MEASPDTGHGDHFDPSSSGSDVRSRSATSKYSRIDSRTDTGTGSQYVSGTGRRSMYTALAEEALLGRATPCDPEGAFRAAPVTSPIEVLPEFQGGSSGDLRMGVAGAFWKVDGTTEDAMPTVSVSRARCCTLLPGGTPEHGCCAPRGCVLGFLAACITVLLIPVAVWDVGLWMRHASGQGFGLSSPGACCTAALAVCFACGAGVSVEEFCADQGYAKGVQGCGGAPCCSNRTAQCLACAAGVTVSHFCANSTHFDIDGCQGEACGLIQKDREYVGGDLYSVGHVLSSDSCCALCQEEDHCTSWSWAGTRCFLKRQVKLDVVVSSGYVSGLRGRDASEFHVKGSSGTCLQPVDGALQLRPCEASAAAQHWTFEQGHGVLKAGGLCLEAPGKSGGGAVVRPCRAEQPAQRWRFESKPGQLRTMEGNQCLHAGAGAAVVTQDCPTPQAPPEWSFWSSALFHDEPAPRVVVVAASSTRTATATATNTSTTTMGVTSTTTTGPPRLFCFSVMLASGFEESLVRMQATSGKGIFVCDGSALYSDAALTFGAITSKVVRGLDLAAQRAHGTFESLFTTSVYAKVWEQIVEERLYAPYDWVVKVEPTTVFFPPRLRTLLHGMLVGSGLGNGVFLNNCGFGLRGPLEVLSRRAVETYKAGYATCERPPQEHVYLQACMIKLGAEQVNEFSLLSDAECRTPNWQACQSEHASFHPFKSVEAYLACEQRADAADHLLLMA